MPGDAGTFTNRPYQLDVGAACGENYIANGSNGMYDGFSILGGHEYGETVTDPYVGTAWSDGSNPFGGEIGDKCAWRYPGTSTPDVGLVTLSGGTFAMQPLLSNSAFSASKQSCPLAASPDTLTVTKPASQTTILGGAVSLQVKAVSSTGARLSHAATGLPAGLVISSTTGKITGTAAAAGVRTVTIAVDDTTGRYASVSFIWTAKPLVGHLKGLCASSYKSGTANGTRVVLWSCSTSSGETWTMARWPVSPLTVGGKCLTDPTSGGAGTGLAIGTCVSTAKTQEWTHLGNGEWVLALSKLCLTDPGYSVKNGTQLTIAACTDIASQRWTLP